MRETPPPHPDLRRGEPGRADRFDYFMIRVRRSEATPFSAVVERIGTGEKREVASSEQLARVMEEWSK
jgi:hypothetical protein